VDVISLITVFLINKTYIYQWVDENKSGNKL